MTHITTSLATLGLLFTIGYPVHDADAQSVPDRDALLACDKVRGDKARLKCFNDLVDAMVTKPEASPSPAEDVPPASESGAKKGDDFGLTGFQKESIAKSKGEEYENENMPVHVVHMNRLSTKRHVFILANGQVWQETDRTIRSLPRKPFDAEIYKSTLGGYQMKIKGRTGFVRVKRTK